MYEINLNEKNITWKVFVSTEITGMNLILQNLLFYSKIKNFKIYHTLKVSMIYSEKKTLNQRDSTELKRTKLNFVFLEQYIKSNKSSVFWVSRGKTPEPNRELRKHVGAGDSQVFPIPHWAEHGSFLENKTSCQDWGVKRHVLECGWVSSSTFFLPLLFSSLLV